MPDIEAEQDPNTVPRDARLMSLLIQAMDIEDYEERVIPQLLDFSHKYVLDLLSDAQLYAEHARRNELTIADVRLSIEGKVAHAFTYPPSKDVMLEYAEKKNSNPLPIVPEKFGVRLPPERHCLTGVNFDIVPKKVKLSTEKKDEDMDVDREVRDTAIPNAKAKPKSSADSFVAFDMPDVLTSNSMPVINLGKRENEDGDDYDAL